VFFFQELGIFQIFGEAGITLAMGFVGTVLGFPFALVFGTLGSERVTPFPFNFIFRGTMSFIRAIPAIIWTLIFIPFLGLGPASAAIAIAFDTIGNLGRLFVDELEEIEDGPIEAMRTTGASKPQIVFFRDAESGPNGVHRVDAVHLRDQRPHRRHRRRHRAGDSATSSRPSRTCCGSPR